MRKAWNRLEIAYDNRECIRGSVALETAYNENDFELSFKGHSFCSNFWYGLLVELKKAVALIFIDKRANKSNNRGDAYLGLYHNKFIVGQPKPTPQHRKTNIKAEPIRTGWQLKNVGAKKRPAHIIIKVSTTH